MQYSFSKHPAQRSIFFHKQLELLGKTLEDKKNFYDLKIERVEEDGSRTELTDSEQRCIQKFRR